MRTRQNADAARRVCHASRFCILHRPCDLCLSAPCPAARHEPPAPEHPRSHPPAGPKSHDRVTEAQATELTLTLTEAAVRPIQVWVRTAGTIDKARQDSHRGVCRLQTAAQVEVGQRVARSRPSRVRRCSRRRVTAWSAAARRRAVDGHADRAGHRRQRALRPGNRHRSGRVPVGAERSDHRIRRQARSSTSRRARASYAPREIKPGLQGELYTQVLRRPEGGEQVVTIGSFFIDADHKLKGS